MHLHFTNFHLAKAIRYFEKWSFDDIEGCGVENNFNLGAALPFNFKDGAHHGA
jgi:hypothetical protein